MTTSQPTNPLVGPLLTDFYQISMAYSYWRHNRHEVEGVFELYFRQNPFGGEFTVFAGLDECIRYLESFKVTDTDIEYLRTLLPRAEPGFFDWLRQLDASDVTVHAVREGTVVFPKCPLLRVHGPIGLAQLLETSLLNLVNFASLVTTNAARMRLAAGPDCRLLEFGLRRAQGPDGGVSVRVRVDGVFRRVASTPSCRRVDGVEARARKWEGMTGTPSCQGARERENTPDARAPRAHDNNKKRRPRATPSSAVLMEPPTSSRARFLGTSRSRARTATATSRRIDRARTSPPTVS